MFEITAVRETKLFVYWQALTFFPLHSYQVG